MNSIVAVLLSPSSLIIGGAFSASLIVVAGSYFLVRRARREVVSSTFFLSATQHSTSGRRKPRMPLRFLFELLLLALLGSFFLPTPSLIQGEKVALIIDTSLSMAMKYERGMTVFEGGKALATEEIKSTDEVTVLLTPRFPNSAFSSSITGSSLHETLRSHKPVYGEDSIPSALELIPARTFAKIIVVTDKQKPQNIPSSVIWREVRGTEKPTNLACLDLSLGPPSSINVSLLNSAKSAVLVRLSLYSLTEKKENLITSTVLPSDGEDTSQLALPLPAPLRPGSYVVRVSPEDARFVDYLSQDNELYFTIRHSTTQVRVVGEPLPIASLGNFQFQVATDSPPSAEIDVFNRCNAPPLLERPTLLLSPIPSSRAPQRKCVETRRITQWNSSHPLTRYIKFSLFSLDNASCVERTEGLESILRGEEGSLLDAGVKNSHRLIFTTLPLLTSSSSLSLSILSLNALTWLGDPLRGKLWEPLSLDEKSLLKIPLTTKKNIGAPHPGIYSTSDFAYPEVAKNFISVQESDPWNQAQYQNLNFPETVDKASVTATWHRPLLFSILILILVEYSYIALFLPPWNSRKKA
jgi:hypothetical protein